MSLQIDPNLFSNNTKEVQSTQTAPTVHSKAELDVMRKADTKVNFQGDIYTYSGVSFKQMSREDLLEEEIDYNSLNLTQNFTTQESEDKRLVVAFRDPQDPSKVMAYKLDREVVEELQSSFSKNDFFQREDGILRLNGNAEEYIASWVLDIKKNRGYEQADKNADGVINTEEQGELSVGFKVYSEYEYLAKKIVTAQSSVEKNYQKLSELGEVAQGDPLYQKQKLHFENSVEKELGHTVMLDADKDGVVTLKEGLEDFIPEDKTLEESFAAQVSQKHLAWIEKLQIKLDLNTLEHKDLTAKLPDEEEEEEKFKIDTYEEQLTLV